MRYLVLAALAACSIPNTQFKPSADAEAHGGDSGVLAIVPSSAGITVDESSTAQFTVTLSQAPTEPVVVQIASESAKVGIDPAQIELTPTNFAQPQAITVTGLADADVADDVAEVSLSADGLDTVTVTATVTDIDTLALVTDIAANNIVSVDEGQSVSVHVKLSNQPSDSEVTVSAILGSGPITVMPTSLVFTQANYDTEQTFVFEAAPDANITTDDIPLTLRMGAVDRNYTVRSIDKDVLNISVSPASLTINEQGAAGNLNVALTQMPSSNVVVSVATSSGHATTNVSQLTFTPANYATNQVIQVNAPDDADVMDDSDTVTLSTTTTGVMPRSVTVTIHDNDSQQILHDVPGTLTVAENADATFGVKLKFKPTGTINVSVVSLATGVATVSPGVLSFDQNNYNTYKTVTVHGVDDTNLVTNSATVRLSEASIGMTDLPVNVTDDDQQRLVVSASTLTVPEGMSRTFDVTLAYDPGTTVNATVANTNSQVPSSPSSLTFTSANYAMAHTVTVSPPLDSNNVSETATITISGAGATNSPAVNVTVMDSTVVETWGWKTPFTGSYELLAGDVIAYQVPVGSVAYLTTFHTFLASAAGTYRMALYTDNGANAPGTLVADSGGPKVGVNGTNTSNPLALPPQLDQPMYWIAIRFSQNNMLGRSTTMTGRQCFRNVAIPDINTGWPASWGSASCMTDNLLNLWITTYHQ